MQQAGAALGQSQRARQALLQRLVQAADCSEGGAASHAANSDPATTLADGWVAPGQAQQAGLQGLDAHALACEVRELLALQRQGALSSWQEVKLAVLQRKLRHCPQAGQATGGAGGSGEARAAATNAAASTGARAADGGSAAAAAAAAAPGAPTLAAWPAAATNAAASTLSRCASYSGGALRLQPTLLGGAHAVLGADADQMQQLLLAQPVMWQQYHHHCSGRQGGEVLGGGASAHVPAWLHQQQRLQRQLGLAPATSQGAQTAGRLPLAAAPVPPQQLAPQVQGIHSGGPALQGVEAMRQLKQVGAFGPSMHVLAVHACVLCMRDVHAWHAYVCV